MSFAIFCDCPIAGIAAPMSALKIMKHRRNQMQELHRIIQIYMIEFKFVNIRRNTFVSVSPEFLFDIFSAADFKNTKPEPPARDNGLEDSEHLLEAPLRQNMGMGVQPPNHFA